LTKTNLNDNWSKKKFLSTLNQDAKELFNYWINSDGYSVKMTSYFSTYAELLSGFRNKKCTLVEIGVLDGGSLIMWKKWLGDKARIIGIDLNPDAKSLENHGFEIYIGNQADAKFWENFYSNVGDIDVLIDDGGHQSFQQIMTIYCALFNLRNKCMVIVEDTATSFYHSMTQYHQKNSFLEFSKDATDVLTVKEREMRPQRWPNHVNETILKVFKHVDSIQFFSGVVSYKVDPYNSLPPVAVHNRDKGKNYDYREFGDISGIEVEWPNPFEKHIVEIKGKSLHSEQKTVKVKLK
jgi:hypothetical protein